MGEIRATVPGDRAAIESMIEATGNLTAEERGCARELLDIYLGDPSQTDYFFITALESGRPAGYACYGKTPLTRGAYDLYWILVAPDFRNRGIGKRLLENTQEILKKKGALLLLAETSGMASYEDARAFYRKAGFSEEARIRDFYKPGDDLVIFVKRF